MNIFMTGNKGLIGSSLKKRLEKEGNKVIGAVDLRNGGDVRSIKGLALRGIDMVVHAAAHCKINQSVSNPRLSHDHNADGTFSVLEFCRNNDISKIVNFSSSRVLSKEKNAYTASKIYGEELCKGYRDCYGIDYVIIRPSTVYGPFWDETKRLMHIFITNALEDKNLEIYGNPETKTLDFTHVDDFVEGTMLAINNSEWNKEYNISGGEEFNVYDLAEFIVKNTSSKSKIKVREAETAQPQKVRLDLTEIERLGYSPRVSLEEGVLRTINWYRDYLGK